MRPILLFAALLTLAACASAGSEAQPALAERGAMLFVNKGCITCHVNSRVEHQGVLIGVGPDLTNYSADAAFLTEWLRNPAAIRPNTAMPTLGLADDEIAALVAFINEPQRDEP